MKARQRPSSIKPDFNELEVGSTYTAKTPSQVTTGQYLGVETAHGVWFILLRHAHGTDSIPRQRILSIRPVAPGLI